MELTDQDVKNLALIELGHETITNWDDPTNTDIPIVNTQYLLAVPVALSKYQWSFANEYATLTTTPIESTDGYQKYKNSVSLPADSLANVSCYTNKNLTVLADYDVLGNTIYTNLDTIYVKYTGQVAEDVWTSEFIDWFKVFFACRLNSYLNADMQRQQYLDAQEAYLFRVAKNIDSKRNKHEALDGNPMLWIRGAMGGGTM